MPEDFKDYINILAVGGSRNGDYILVHKSQLKSSIRFPIQPKLELTASENPLPTTAALNYQIYEKREYTDANGIKREFLVYQSLSDQEAATELYLLGILDVDENYESKANAD